MSHFSHISSGVVDQVIVADDSFISILSNASEWVQTSYNTIAGVHVDPVTRLPDGGTALRMNYAGIGFFYDGTGFYAPQPFPSWTFNSSTYQWEAPVPYPNDGAIYTWNEATQNWIHE